MRGCGSIEVVTSPSTVELGEGVGVGLGDDVGEELDDCVGVGLTAVGDGEADDAVGSAGAYVESALARATMKRDAASAQTSTTTIGLPVTVSLGQHLWPLDNRGAGSFRESLSRPFLPLPHRTRGCGRHVAGPRTMGERRAVSRERSSPSRSI